MHKYAKICNGKYASKMQVYTKIFSTKYAIIYNNMHIDNMHIYAIYMQLYALYDNIRNPNLKSMHKYAIKHVQKYAETCKK